jgi:hypothetical protein
MNLVHPSVFHQAMNQDEINEKSSFPLFIFTHQNSNRAFLYKYKPHSHMPRVGFA